jgi:hypothetical protein
MACWKITIEIVNFPMNSMVVFHDDVNVYQRVNDLPDVPKCLGDSPRKQGISWLSPGKIRSMNHTHQLVDGLSTDPMKFAVVYINWCRIPDG